MREIKFRGYCEKDSEWRYGFYITDGKTHEILTLMNCGSMYASQVDPESVGQYTGLNDKNEVEIYERDIVGGVLYKDYSEHKGKVQYDYNGYRIVTKDKSLELCLTEKLEVIGNIYENPELLEK